MKLIDSIIPQGGQQQRGTHKIVIMPAAYNNWRKQQEVRTRYNRRGPSRGPGFILKAIIAWQTDTYLSVEPGKLKKYQARQYAPARQRCCYGYGNMHHK